MNKRRKAARAEFEAILRDMVWRNLYREPWIEVTVIWLIQAVNAVLFAIVGALAMVGVVVFIGLMGWGWHPLGIAWCASSSFLYWLIRWGITDTRLLFRVRKQVKEEKRLARMFNDPF